MSANENPRRQPAPAVADPAETKHAETKPAAATSAACLSASSPDARSAADPRCERCNAPIRPVPGFPALCDRCIELAGSCCCE